MTLPGDLVVPVSVLPIFDRPYKAAGDAVLLAMPCAADGGPFIIVEVLRVGCDDEALILAPGPHGLLGWAIAAGLRSARDA